MKEHDLQVLFVNTFRAMGIMVFSITNHQQSLGRVPNMRQRFALMSSLKREGLLAGVADLLVLLPGRVIFVEMKSPEHMTASGRKAYAGRQSDEQKEFQSAVEKLGFEYYVCKSIVDVENLANRLAGKAKV